MPIYIEIAFVCEACGLRKAHTHLGAVQYDDLVIKSFDEDWGYGSKSDKLLCPSCLREENERGKDLSEDELPE